MTFCANTQQVPTYRPLDRLDPRSQLRIPKVDLERGHPLVGTEPDAARWAARSFAAVVFPLPGRPHTMMRQPPRAGYELVGVSADVHEHSQPCPGPILTTSTRKVQLRCEVTRSFGS